MPGILTTGAFNQKGTLWVVRSVYPLSVYVLDQTNWGYYAHKLGHQDTPSHPIHSQLVRSFSTYPFILTTTIYHSLSHSDFIMVHNGAQHTIDISTYMHLKFHNLLAGIEAAIQFPSDWTLEFLQEVD